MKKLVALLLTFLLVLTGCKTIEVTKVEDDIKTDAIKFSKEYKNVSKENIYKYSTYTNVIDTIKKENGIIYLGFPTCTLCKEITPILNDIAKDRNEKEILYYNFKDIRSNNTEEYIKLVELLGDYLPSDEEGNKKLTAPTIIFVNKGNITGVYIGTIPSNTEEVITEETKKEIMYNLASLTDEMINYKPEEEITEE